MRDDVVIEEVRDLDAAWPELSLLFLGLHNYHEPLVPRTLRDDWEVRWRDYLAPGEDRLILVARRDGEAVGYMNAKIQTGYGLFDERVGFVDDAFLVEEHRSQGIGRILLRRVEDWLRSRGIDEVRLSVAASNKQGVRFWTLAGFELQSMTMRKALV